MKVKELIKQLQECPEDMEVWYMNYRQVVTPITENHKETVFCATIEGDKEPDIFVGNPTLDGIDIKKDEIHREKEVCFLS